MDSNGGAGAGGGPGGGPGGIAEEAQAEAGNVEVEDEGETAPIGHPRAHTPPFVPPPASDHIHSSLSLPFYMVLQEHRHLRPGMLVAPPHYRHRPAPGSAPLTELEELIESCEFDEALEFIRTRPGEILPEGTRFHGDPAKDGEDEDAVAFGRMTALHVAIDNAHTPPSVVCALLVAVPSAVRAVDEDGSLPLHYACAGRHACGEEGAALVRLLLAMYPRAAAVAELAQNATPLHFLMQLSGNVKSEVVRMLLDAAYMYGRGDCANADANAPLEAPAAGAGSATQGGGEGGGGDRKPVAQAKGGPGKDESETSADALRPTSTGVRGPAAAGEAQAANRSVARTSFAAAYGVVKAAGTGKTAEDENNGGAAATASAAPGGRASGRGGPPPVGSDPSMDEAQAREGATYERLALSLRPAPPSQQHPVISQGQAVAAPPVTSGLADAAGGEEQEGRSGQAPTLAAAVPSAQDQALTVPVGDEQARQLLLQCLLSMLPSAQSDGGAVAPGLQCAGTVPQAGVVSPEVSQGATNAFVTVTFVPTKGLMDEALKIVWQYLLAGGYEGLYRYFSTMLPSSAPPDLTPAATDAGVVGSQANGAPQLAEGEQPFVTKLREAGVACFSKPPPPKSQLAAKASGGILRICDLFEMTPLHHACCRPYTGGDESLFVNFVEIIQALLNDSSYPGAASVVSIPDRKGRLPLHHILDLTVSRWDNGGRTMPHLDAVTAVLEAFPGAASVPDGITGLSPIHLVYLSAPPAYRRLRIDAVHHAMGVDAGAYCAKQLWETIKALLLAFDEADAGGVGGGNGREGRRGGGDAFVAGREGHRAQRRHRLVLHAAARFPCPPSVFRAAIRLHGGQARLRDENGDLPLHAAARRRGGFPGGSGAAGGRHPWLPAEFVRPPDGGGRRGRFDVTYARFVAEEEEEDRARANAEEAEAEKEDHVHVDELVLLVNKFGPGSSYLDRDGRLPLNLAIESGRSWVSGGIPAIANAAPLALVTRDTKTRLYPFMLAAVGVNSDLETIFELLKLAPSVLLGRFAGRDGVTKGGQKRNQSIGGGAGVDSVSVKKQRSA